MRALILVTASLLASIPAFSQAPPSEPAKPAVYVIAPSNGARVHSPFTVRFGLKGMGIAPAGVKFDNTGHHHLLVDTDLSEIQFGSPLPSTDKILHFGKGQTETELSLSPGKHTLQLLFGDAQHMPFTPPMASKKITVTVVK